SSSIDWTCHGLWPQEGAQEQGPAPAPRPHPRFPAPAPFLFPRPGPHPPLALACLLSAQAHAAPQPVCGVLGASFLLPEGPHPLRGGLPAPPEQGVLWLLTSLALNHRCFTSTTAGLGRSKEAAAPVPIGELVPSSFLGAVVDALDLGPPVVISPSLSGMYSLPFLTAPGSQVRGYVPVAPICTDKISAADYASVKTSALIVYGDQDPMGQTSFEHLKQLPNHRVLVMEGAGHPCYLDKPEEWHTGLLAFLQGL
uniref:Abhydrolase domain containing 14B n=1 Tax=Equus asinus TaxID=9793 RepID=A0A9L0JT06_EQUAS